MNGDPTDANVGETAAEDKDEDEDEDEGSKGEDVKVVA
jgi:hypothetical protein